jgi:hypothetical protein
MGKGYGQHQQLIHSQAFSVVQTERRSSATQPPTCSRVLSIISPSRAASMLARVDCVYACQRIDWDPAGCAVTCLCARGMSVLQVMIVIVVVLLALMATPCACSYGQAPAACVISTGALQGKSRYGARNRAAGWL